MQIKLPYGKETFDVKIQWSQRKNLTITVFPDLNIVAKAPIGTNMESIRKKLTGKASWVAKQINFFEQFQPIQPERKYINGETHYYLGRQYRLKIKKSNDISIKLIGRFFEVRLSSPADREKVKSMMDYWYRSHAEELFKSRISLKTPFFTQNRAKESVIKVRKMKKRWGSCSEHGVITLNLELIKAPIQCIDYVIIHELCHLVNPKHNQGFYRLLRRVEVNWQDRKLQLEKAISKT